jgi:octaprenyl-diphosphate synthase
MDYLSLIKEPIKSELGDFNDLFNQSMSHGDGLLHQALTHIRQKSGKRMRPMLILLIAKNFGNITDITQHAAVGLELLHTASLVHDDVVDESAERRGQRSVNALYDNKVAVLVGDYILSTALLHVSYTHEEKIVRFLAELGQTLSNGEILQLSNIQNQEISEEVYYQVIKQKTAALFEACAGIGALSVGASDEAVDAAKKFGQNLGVIFQIRDDIFDYYDDPEIGKPTGNDMKEGKLTLPVIYALNSTNNQDMMVLAKKVKDGTVNEEEIGRLVDFAKRQGGIEYADKCMWELHSNAELFLETYVSDPEVKAGLMAYLDFVIERQK